MRFNYDLLPEELKKEKRFVLWKINERGKVPINANTNALAKSNDQNTWVTFDEAVNSKYTPYVDGIGFMLGDGYVGIDLDNHDGSNMRDIFNEFYVAFRKNAYIEYSQSKKGVHLILKGKLQNGMRHKGNFEMYDSNRFFALTGLRVNTKNEIDFIDDTETLNKYHTKYLGGKAKSFTFYRSDANGEVEKTSLANINDDAIIEEALKTDLKFAELYKGHWENNYKSQSEADMALVSKLAYYLNKDKNLIDLYFKNSGLYRDKWDRVSPNSSSSSYKERTINNAINLISETYADKKNKTNLLFSSDTLPQVNKSYSFDDSGNAERFADTYRSVVRYNFDNKTWFIFNGKIWEEDKNESIKILADKLIVQMKEELKNIDSINEKDKCLAIQKNIKRLSSSVGKEAMLKEVKHLLPISNSEFNKDNSLLVCDNGVIDLKEKKMFSFNLVDHTKEYFSKKCDVAYNENAKCPRFIAFLNDIFMQANEKIDYLQVALGYSLTGETKEQCMFQCVGSGGNGKGVLFNTIEAILGSYSTTIQIETILAKPTNGGAQASPDIARLDGARWVKTSEPSEGQKFNEGLVKQLTGEDKITTRFLYGNNFEFMPKFKLWLMANNQIIIRGTDEGIWRRMRIIKFERKFQEDEQDKDLKAKLLEEKEGILAWLVEGAYKYYKDGLKTPEEIKEATKDYKKQMDVISNFIDENLLITQNIKDKINATKLYNEYREWAVEGKEYVYTKTKFGIEMGKRFTKKTISGSNYYYGIKLKKEGFTYDKPKQ